MNPTEFGVIAVVALILIGPQRLPEYAAQLAKWVRQARVMAMGAKDQVKAEMGPEFQDVDWQKLDPRQYDPRRIVRDALLEPLDEDAKKPSEQHSDDEGDSAPAPAGIAHAARTGPPPFDEEAT